jgi:formylglycine-generating enzyme required for sulfatase activity
MSKYETTNAQYCVFLNAALATGDVIVDGTNVKGSSGSNPGTDYTGVIYYNLAGSGYTAGDAVNGGAARIHYSGGVFTIDSGFENHPVTYVSARGAMAFCNYYGWRLPNEWEWQAVADYTGGYTYGCGTAINTGNANFVSSSHLYGTKEVGIMGTYGYGMCDMAANVWEWTSSTNLNNHYIRGGGWNNAAAACTVSFRWEQSYDILNAMTGFRVCR